MSTLEAPPAASIEREPSIYTRVFWLSYFANLALVTANAFTFRFAEFVAYLARAGGIDDVHRTESITGNIVSLGLAASFTTRFVLGQAIDRYGASRVWVANAVLLLIGSALYILSDRIGPLLLTARVVFAIGIAGVAACSLVHVQHQVPPHRRTEIIGALGSSGFLGMVMGSHASDWVLNHLHPDHFKFVVLFSCTSTLAFLYLSMVMYLTRGDQHERPRHTPAAHRLIFRYWPGVVVLVAMTMGMTLAIPTVFLTRFATHLRDSGIAIRGIGVFFTGYTMSAFIFRVSGSRFNESIGRHRMILAGLAGHAIGTAMLPYVASEWHFILPSIASGFGHAMLFPAVVSIGSGAFPRAYRGTGTTIVLGFLEIGTMVFAPLLGWIIDQYSFAVMFWTSSLIAVGVAALYAVTGARRPDVDRYGNEALDEIESVVPTAITEDAEPQPATATR
jgi:MFS family permease